MGDRPIMFSGPMVRAILDGTKAQTRRVIEPFEAVPHPFSGREAAPNLVTVRVPARHGGFIAGPTFRLRYAPRDRLWVREAWRTLHTSDCLAPRHLAEDPSKVTFEADPHRRNPLWAFGRLRPSMFMPRWASRLTLIVADVRVQRLQDISEADAIAEGCPARNDEELAGMDASGWFCSLWDDLNAKRGYGWDANPWVCAITFEAHRCNIDQMPEIGTPRKETSHDH